MNMTIPFRVRGEDGTVSVEYVVNEDPYHWGYALLGLENAQDIAKGFPVCRASVSFGGRDYGAVMGWIQILRYHGTQNGILVDKPPQLAETDMPYCYWGVCPTFFDAPSTTGRGIIWTADAFLVISPDAVMTRVVQPICGFRWGFTTQGEQPRPLPITQVDASAWAQARAILQERYPHWVFKSEWTDEQT